MYKQNNQSSPFQAKKTCHIINDRFSYILEVDEQQIPFQGSHNAEYFEKHYLNMGYDVKYTDRNKVYTSH